MAQTAQLKTFEIVANEAQRVFKAQREAYLLIVSPRRNHKRGPMASLLVPSLRIEFEPDEIPAIRNVASGHYQTSLPTGSPVSSSR